MGFALAVFVYLAFINLATFLAFFWDKRSAEAGRWRVAESRLLLLAAAGGTFGAFTASRTLRHKTRKQPFRAFLILIAVGQFALLAAILALNVWGS